MKATARFVTGLRNWRDYGAVHLQATLSLAGMALDGIQVEIRAGSVTGEAVVSGERIDGPALAELLAERCRLDEVRVIIHSAPAAPQERPTGPPILTSRGTRGKRKAIRE